MKKILAVVAVLLLIGGSAFALNNGDSHAETIYSYQTINSTGSAQITYIPVTSIRPGVDKLVAYEINSYASPYDHLEPWVTLFDTTATWTVGTMGEVLGESEATYPDSGYRMFPNARSVIYGLAVYQGPNTIVTIYFITV